MTASIFWYILISVFININNFPFHCKLVCSQWEVTEEIGCRFEVSGCLDGTVSVELCSATQHFSASAAVVSVFKSMDRKLTFETVKFLQHSSTVPQYLCQKSKLAASYLICWLFAPTITSSERGGRHCCSCFGLWSDSPQGNESSSLAAIETHSQLKSTDYWSKSRAPFTFRSVSNCHSRPCFPAPTARVKLRFLSLRVQSTADPTLRRLGAGGGARVGGWGGLGSRSVLQNRG